MAATVDIYVQVLLDLIVQRGFELFVHPVPPVLNETRPLVTPFMGVMKDKVKGGWGEGARDVQLVVCGVRYVVFVLGECLRGAYLWRWANMTVYAAWCAVFKTPNPQPLICPCHEPLLGPCVCADTHMPGHAPCTQPTANCT